MIRDRQMTNPLTIAATTAILRDLLNNQIVQRRITVLVGDVSVTTLPLDRIQHGPDERAQLNLFLYRVTPNTRWMQPRLTERESRAHPRPALALDLYYLVTAFGQQDFQSEILLGFAIQVMQESAILAPEQVRSILASVSENTAGGAAAALSEFAASDFTDTLDRFEIRPEFANSEEISRIWSTIQSPYRPSVAYKVSALPGNTGQ
jgi:hypothetical protein